ncbi:hypothetical protein CWB96_00085 [Pseudoalteromonas citrea]|uniref:Uncharacterized protein n=2 Tax=Pseudoalteromonas citrea TaxID=43655 RepID=A0A5S3XXS7_9GAMM|nr:hypothetical protein CWB97_02080 [Pseudoalteromonas citrea]TMP63040.1 hypothetical protein CWB96_00085 [Pseudoalteromonas citrea]
MADAEASDHATQNQFKYVMDSCIVHTRYLEGKPAILVVVDSQSKVLFSISGKMKWHKGPWLGTQSLLINDFCFSAAGLEQVTPNRVLFGSFGPNTPALVFSPSLQVSEDIKAKGVISQGYLLVDFEEKASTVADTFWTDVPDSRGVFDASKTSYPYTKISVDDVRSMAAVRLTNSNLDVVNQSILAVDAQIYISPNALFTDFNVLKNEFEALLMSIDGVDLSGHVSE